MNDLRPKRGYLFHIEFMFSGFKVSSYQQEIYYSLDEINYGLKILQMNEIESYKSFSFEINKRLWSEILNHGSEQANIPLTAPKAERDRMWEMIKHHFWNRIFHSIEFEENQNRWIPKKFISAKVAMTLID